VAEINIERKRTTVWPWIVGLIAVALLVWALAEVLDREEEPEPVPQPVGVLVQGVPRTA